MRGREKLLLMPIVKVLAAGTLSINQTDERIKKRQFYYFSFLTFFHGRNEGFLRHNLRYRSYSKQIVMV